MKAATGYRLHTRPNRARLSQAPIVQFHVHNRTDCHALEAIGTAMVRQGACNECAMVALAHIFPALMSKPRPAQFSRRSLITARSGDL
jgi:hypothetical protein